MSIYIYIYTYRNITFKVSVLGPDPVRKPSGFDRDPIRPDGPMIINMIMIRMTMLLLLILILIPLIIRMNENAQHNIKYIRVRTPNNTTNNTNTTKNTYLHYVDYYYSY